MSEKSGDKRVPSIVLGGRLWVGDFGEPYMVVVLESTVRENSKLRVRASTTRGEYQERFIFLGDLGHPDYAYDDRPCCVNFTEEAAKAAIKARAEWKNRS